MPEKDYFWLPNLSLKMSDKEAISNNEKLNSQIIEAENILVRGQFSSMSGLQLPEKNPKYITKENDGIYSNKQL